MTNYVVPVSMPKEAYAAVKKVRNEAEAIPYAICLNVLLALMMTLMIGSAGIIALDFHRKDTLILSEAVVVILLLPAVWLRAKRWAAQALRARKTLRLVRAGNRVNPKIADPLTVCAIAADVAEERYNRMVRIWLAYEQCLKDDAEIADESMRMQPIENEAAVRESLIAAGREIQEYANDVGKELRRESRHRDFAKLLAETQGDSFSDAFGNLRNYNAQFREALEHTADAPTATTAERLLAEPIATAKLDALDKELAELPTRRAQPTNG